MLCGQFLPALFLYYRCRVLLVSSLYPLAKQSARWSGERASGGSGARVAREARQARIGQRCFGEGGGGLKKSLEGK